MTIHTTAAAITTTVIEDITCDICGKSCNCNPPDSYSYEYATLDASWGYHSHKDGRSDEAHICESCYDKIVEHFNIKISIKSAW
jgi:hypothetical protein